MALKLNGTRKIAPRTCADCTHFGELGRDPANISQRLGECRKYPPTVQFIPLQTAAGLQIQKLGSYPPVQNSTPACSKFASIVAPLSVE